MLWKKRMIRPCLFQPKSSATAPEIVPIALILNPERQTVTVEDIVIGIIHITIPRSAKAVCHILNDDL
ncbi:MAG TPA: hypothetical protein DDY98_00950 [Ruminococcaceae bacterium]|nr:hypothetical protein [Oscillospiraceae bacterium]